jgi:hypothetical protein
VRYSAIDFLGWFGERAMAAVPALERAMNHPREAVRTAATNALYKINPGAFAKPPPGPVWQTIPPGP